MDNLLWLIIKLFIPIIFAILGILHRLHLWGKNKIQIMEKDPKADFLSYAFYEPFTFSLLLYISVAITEITFINFSDFFNTKPEINLLSKNLNKTYKTIGDNKILSSIVDDKIKELNKFTTYATNNEKHIVITNSKDFLISAKKIFEMADNNSTILATSYVKKSDWWFAIDGKEYLQKNYDFIKKKSGTIKRIHIFVNQDEFDFYRDLMQDEKTNGINVFFIFVDDIPKELNYNLKQDIILLGKEIAGKLDLNDERMPQQINYYASSERIDEFNNVFSTLQKWSKEFK